MFDAIKESLKPLLKGRLVPSVLGIVGVGIAVAVYVSNATPSVAHSCAAQPDAAEAIDLAAQGELAAVLPTATGRGYSDLAFLDETGRPMTLADFAGKPLLVNFWATWCVPCREEMPALNNLAENYDLEEFTVVPINLDLGEDGVSKARTFLDGEGLSNLPILVDPTFETFDRLKSQAVAIGLPATLLLDAEGCEIGVLQGPAVWDGDDAHTLIDALVALKS